MDKQEWLLNEILWECEWIAKSSGRPLDEVIAEHQAISERLGRESEQHERRLARLFSYRRAVAAFKRLKAEEGEEVARALMDEFSIVDSYTATKGWAPRDTDTPLQRAARAAMVGLLNDPAAHGPFSVLEYLWAATGC
jgi:hypothetical protein